MFSLSQKMWKMKMRERNAIEMKRRYTSQAQKRAVLDCVCRLAKIILTGGVASTVISASERFVYGLI
jgi:hypothetical protein